MPTTRREPVSLVRAAVQRWHDRLGPSLIGLACSGGTDSMVLADAAIEVCGPAAVVVVHIDHGLRDDSARIGREVAAWAGARGVAAIVRRVEVATEGSLEARARDARYAAFDAIADETGLASMWIAHTRDDQAETILMRIVRGTGPAGLAGMAAQRGRFVRPLLDVTRDTVAAYARERALPEWYDPMNHDERITRVRFRGAILPALRAENPALDDALVRLADSAREWLEAIDVAAAPHAAFPIDCGAVARLPAAVRKRVYARALEAATLGYDASHLERIDEVVTRPTAGSVRLDIAGAALVRSYNALTVVEPAQARPAPPVTAIPAGYMLRTPRPGDRMKPARLHGRSRKLSDLFIDAKVPRSLRQTARVLVRITDEQIVWAEYIGSAFGESFQDI